LFLVFCFPSCIFVFRLSRGVFPSKSTVPAPFILEETELELVELGLVQTIKTDDPLVSTDPFPSMVPI
jgi:hypothetical protein